MDELGKSLPGAEGMVDAEENVKSTFHNEFCLNCGTRLTDAYCHHCGQKDIPRRQTLGELLLNFISSFWSYEGKFFRTTRYLITKPGFLAIEYNAGRRESYYHPARMYVFISFIFFFFYFSLPDKPEDVELTREDLKDLKKDVSAQQLDSLFNALPADESDSSVKIVTKGFLDSLRNKKSNKNFSLSKSEYESVRAYDSVQQRLPEKDRDGWLGRGINIRVIELNNRYKGNAKQFGEDFGKLFGENFSKVLFYLLPVFALLLKLLYMRRDYFYSEHLVFTIYYYNFFYLAGSLGISVGLIPWLGWSTTFINLWIYFYLLFAMKRMYGQGWGKTIAKFTLFSLAFFFCLGLGLLINLIATAFSI